MAVGADGKIAAVAPGAQEAQCLLAHGGRAEAVLHLQVGQQLISLLACACVGHSRTHSLDYLPPALHVQPCQFLLPGLIDCHIHASQYCYAGTATDTPLMSWLHKARSVRGERRAWGSGHGTRVSCAHVTDAPLNAECGTKTNILLQYTFPTEARFAADPAFARDAYAKLMSHLLAGGTTTALFFATLHQEPCRLLADLLEAAGMRAFVGKVGD